MSRTGDALAIRQKLPGGALICALHEAGTSRELYFEDDVSAVAFAELRRVPFEHVERARGFRAEDHLSGGLSAWTEVEHRIVF